MTSFVTLLLDPAFLFLYLSIGLSVWLLHFLTNKKRKILIGVIVVQISFCILLTPIVIRSIERWYVSGEVTLVEVPASADCYVILSGGLHSDEFRFERVYPSLRVNERMLHFKYLYKMHPLPVILSGGKTEKVKSSEAEMMRVILLELGVAEDDIILEDRSLDTYQNAKFTKEVLTEHRFIKPILITDRVHMPRSRRCFKKFDIDMICSVPANLKNGDEQFGSFTNTYFVSTYSFKIYESLVHEWVGLIYYYIVGYI